MGVLRVPDRPLGPKLALAALNLTAAVLFFARSRAVTEPTLRGLASAIPSMILGGAAVKLTAHWSVAGQIVFCAGAAFAALSLATLGRSFSFFPARRDIVVRGPYRWVRHPAYLGELVMGIGCAIALPWPNALLVGLAAASHALRIGAEERLLREDEIYVAYMEKVRYRLVPFVY
ncbi:MAG: isoprenylcysteine carboxylmethyltransferase family protein [Sandaracinaceae bacterium]